MFFVILALAEAGDEAIYPNPGPDLRVDDQLRRRDRGADSNARGLGVPASIVDELDG